MRAESFPFRHDDDTTMAFSTMDEDLISSSHNDYNILYNFFPSSCRPPGWKLDFRDYYFWLLSELP